MDIKYIIKIVVFIITLSFQFLAFIKLGDKGWKAAVPVYKHYTFGKLSGHPISGLLWGIFSLISDFVLSFLVSDIAVIMYQAVLTKNFSTNLSDSTIVSAILYLILHVLMVFTRIVIFNAYGKRFKFSKLFILICSFIPAIGYAAISIQKN